MISQGSSQMKPSRPTRRKVPFQPKLRNSRAIRGAETMAPIEAPALNTPWARARSRGGNHSALALTAPGQAPASVKPSMARKMLKDRIELAVACSMIEIDQVAIDTAKPIRTPILSKIRPKANWPAA